MAVITIQISFFIYAFYTIAHLHHAWENYTKFGRTSRALKNALFSSLFQFIYTSIFGWYASYVFLRTGSIWPPIVCHSFCNMMGVPDVSDIGYRSTFQKSGRYQVLIVCPYVETNCQMMYALFYT